MSVRTGKRKLNKLQKQKNKVAKRAKVNQKYSDRARGNYTCIYHDCGEDLTKLDATEYVKIPPEGKNKKKEAWRRQIFRSLNLEYEPTTAKRLCVKHFQDNCITQVTTPQGTYSKLINVSAEHQGDTFFDSLPDPRNGRATGFTAPTTPTPQVRRLSELRSIITQAIDSKSNIEYTVVGAGRMKKMVDLIDEKRQQLNSEHEEAQQVLENQSQIKLMQERIKQLESKVEQAERAFISWAVANENWSQSYFYKMTGLTSKEVFEELFAAILRIFKDPSDGENGPGRKPALCLRDQLMVTLYILREGVEYATPALAFGVDETTIGRYFRKWVYFIAEAGHDLFPPITAQRIRREYPPDWEAAFGNSRVVMVVDSTNINIETCEDPSVNTITYSKYYGGNVVKLLIGQTPQGYLSYFSRAFPGKITDTDLLESSLFVSEQLEQMTDVLADKGFMNFSILARKKIGLRIPPKSRNGYDFTLHNAEDTRLFANKRIHVSICLTLFFVDHEPCMYIYIIILNICCVK